MKKITVITIATILVLFFIFNRNGKNYEALKGNQSVKISAKKEISQKATDVNTEARMEKLLKLIELSNVPVKLYGVVIDENERPVSGAVVSWRVQQGGYFNSPPPIRKKSITDADGAFTIEGVRGILLGFDEIAKDGYHQAYKEYSVKHQNPNNPKEKPLKFLMLKDDVLDAKDLGDMSVSLNWNSGPTLVPIGSDGQNLTILATRDPNFQPMRWHEWDINISISNGELMDMGENSARIAPLIGYTQSIHYGKNMTDSNANFGEDRNIVFRTYDKKYGYIRLSVSLGLAQKEKCLTLNLSMNEQGMRNLNTHH